MTLQQMTSSSNTDPYSEVRAQVSSGTSYSHESSLSQRNTSQQPIPSSYVGESETDVFSPSLEPAQLVPHSKRTKAPGSLVPIKDRQRVEVMQGPDYTQNWDDIINSKEENSSFFFKSQTAVDNHLALSDNDSVFSFDSDAQELTNPTPSLISDTSSNSDTDSVKTDIDYNPFSDEW